MRELSQSLLDEMLQRLVTTLHPLEIHLFGSRARGTPGGDSDVDLLVVVPDGDDSHRELARRGRESLQGVGVPVDLVVCNSSEMQKWSGVGCNLFHTVAEKGQLVYAATD